MNTIWKNIRALRKPLIVLAIASVLGALLVIFTGQMREQSRADLQKQQAVLSDAHRRLLKSGEERELIVRYLPEYQALQKQGFVGSEQRVSWLDGLRNANQQADLFGVEYQVGAQEEFKTDSGVPDNRIVTRQSLMKLDFRMLHEDDLMRFFRTLAIQDVGLFSINYCSLERVADIRTLQFQPYLRAKCALAWISYNEAQAPKPNE